MGVERIPKDQAMGGKVMDPDEHRGPAQFV